MIRHVVMFRWHDDADPSAVERALEEVSRLPELIGTLRSFSVGRDAGISEGNFDLVVVADFDDRDGYRTYAQHPEHVRVGRDHLQPLAAERAAVQYEH